METGFDDFDDLLDALRPRRRKFKPGSRRALAKRVAKANRKRGVRQRRAKAFVARVIRPVSPNKANATRKATAASLAQRRGGAPGRWFVVLKAMAPGLYYARADLARVSETPVYQFSSILRDLMRRELVARVVDKNRFETVKGRFRAGKPALWIYRMTEEGERIAREEAPGRKTYAPRRRAGRGSKGASGAR